MQRYAQNSLLAKLSDATYQDVQHHMSPISLKRGSVMAKEGKPIEHVYFLGDGIGSVVARTPEGTSCEAGIFGREGYVPTSAIAGVEQASFDVVIQLEAEGLKMPYESFRHFMDSNREFAKIIIRSIEGFAVQLAYTAVSNAVHDVTERLARWLLMCHDRVSSNELALTHEFLALMLAVRRPSVTTSLHILEGMQLIRAERVNITIRDRARLEEFAHDAYGKAEKEYARIMSGI